MESRSIQLKIFITGQTKPLKEIYQYYFTAKPNSLIKYVEEIGQKGYTHLSVYYPPHRIDRIEYHEVEL